MFSAQPREITAMKEKRTCHSIFNHLAVQNTWYFAFQRDVRGLVIEISK